METSCSYSNKRKFAQISGKKDGSFEARYDALEAENAKLKKEMKSKDSLIVKQAVKINEMESRPSNDDDVDKEIEEELERMKDVAAELKAELEETLTKMEDERKLLKDEIDDLKSAAVTRDNKIIELEEQLSAVKDFKDELEAKNTKLEDENRKYEAKILEMKCQIDDLMQEDAASEARAKEARQMIEYRNNEIKELKELLSCAKDVKVESKTKIDILEDEKKEYEAEINELKLQVDDLTQKNAALEALAEKALNMADARDNEIKDLKQQLSTEKAAKNELAIKYTADGSVGEECLWMKECKIAWGQVLRELAEESFRKAFCRYNNNEGDVDEVLKKLEEKNFKSPKEFLNFLTKFFGNLPDKTGKKSQVLRSLENKFKPIIEKYTPGPAKNEQPKNRPRFDSCRTS